MNKIKTIICMTICTLILWGNSLPYNIQSLLIIRLLPYDNKIKTKTHNNTINISILFNLDDPSSLKERNKIKNELFILKEKKIKIENFFFQIYSDPYISTDDLKKRIRSKKIKVLYITKGNTQYLNDILKITKQLKVLTIIGDNPIYHVKKGVSIGLGTKKNRPKIFINLKSSVKEGCQFSGQLLSLAELVK